MYTALMFGIQVPRPNRSPLSRAWSGGLSEKSVRKSSQTGLQKSPFSDCFNFNYFFWVLTGSRWHDSGPIWLVELSSNGLLMISCTDEAQYTLFRENKERVASLDYKVHKSSELNDKIHPLSMPLRMTHGGVFWSDAPISRATSFACAFKKR